MKAILTVGVSGCGKSFWSNQQKGFNVISRDDFRKEELLSLGIDVSEINIWKHFNFKKHEKNSYERWRVALDNAVEDKEDLILADTWLNENLRNQIIAELEAVGYEVELKVFFTDYYVYLKQNRLRKDSLEDSVIAEQWKKFAEQFLRVENEGKQKCVCVDLDGTISKMNNRKPYDWDKVSQDSFDDIVWSAVCGIAKAKNAQIIFLSGRDGICYEDTLEWLTYHTQTNPTLFMRKENDMRDDRIIKKELWEKHIKNNFKVIAVFDDRPKVVSLWNDMGFKTFALGDQRVCF